MRLADAHKRPILSHLVQSRAGPTRFFVLLVITISFAPIFTLEAQKGRLFRPLAFYAMTAPALLSLTFAPPDGSGRTVELRERSPTSLRTAAPMVGGVLTTALVVLLVFPAVYCVWRGWGLSPSPALTQMSPAQPPARS